MTSTPTAADGFLRLDDEQIFVDLRSSSPSRPWRVLLAGDPVTTTDRIAGFLRSHATPRFAVERTGRLVDAVSAITAETHDAVVIDSAMTGLAREQVLARHARSPVSVFIAVRSTNPARRASLRLGEVPVDLMGSLFPTFLAHEIGGRRASVAFNEWQRLERARLRRWSDRLIGGIT